MIIEDYGELYSKGLNKKLISYESFGSYQGDFIVTLENGDNIELYKNYFGSCSGCDFLESEKSWETGEIPDEKVIEYLKNEKPFVSIPKETMSRLDLETFIEILPKNTRADIYDFEPLKLFNSIKEKL